ncbi:hypothetical protein [Anaerocolumna sp.]|uniref:hypothetical protein n=1 Tax=Anaerocolumna sp. TaxID=2041569 RepID=UPI0028AE5AAC|nr:hypothetical protein [Anaerocolumna sp.]
MDEEVNKNKFWDGYRNIGLTDAENIIKSNLNGCSRNFVAIGFYLKDIRDNETYLKGGYDSIWAFALDRLQMSKSTVSRFMAINDRFSVDGNSPVLMDKYLDYGSGKLQEMLTMTDGEIEKINPDTTVKEIRKIKQSRCDAQQKNVSERDITKSSGKCIHRAEYDCTLPESAKITTLNGENCSASCCWNCIKHGECKIECNSSAQRPEEKKPDIPTFELNGKAYGATWSTIIESLVTEMVEMDMVIADIDGICCHVFGFNYYAYNMGTGYITIENEDEKPTFRTSIERFEGEYEWHKARLATLSPEEPEDDEEPKSVNDTAEIVNESEEIVLEPGTDTFPCDTCGWDINGCCNHDSSELDYCVRGDKWKPKTNTEINQDELEIVEADVVQTIPENEEDEKEFTNPEQYTYRDVDDELDKLMEYVEMYRKNNDIAPGRRKAKMRLDAIILLDKEMRKPPVNEEPEPVQPELPVLKNNDQRKEWIDNYETWPVWIDIPQTGERYYRYDFSNDTSFVIRVSLQHAYKGYERTEDIKHAHEEYFLLGVKDKWIPGMPTFVESSTNKSAMVEHLKEIQKKGV